MQPHHHVRRVTRVLWRSLPCLKCIQQLSSAYYEHEISSVRHIGFGCPATSPKRWGSGLSCAISLPPPLSSFPSCFLCSLYMILGKRSVSNGSGPSLRVRVRVGTEPQPDWQSGLSINQNCRFGYGSIDISLPVSIGRVLSGLYSGSICKFI